MLRDRALPRANLRLLLLRCNMLLMSALTVGCISLIDYGSGRL